MGAWAVRARSGGIGFDMPEGEIDGYGSVRALGRFGVTGGGPLGDVGCDLRNTDNRHFEETMQRPSVTHLNFVRDESVSA